MNKILVSDIIELCNNEYVVNVKSNDVIFNIEGNVKVYLIDELINNLDINLKDNSKLDIYVCNKNVNNNLVINIKQNNNSEINLNLSIISNAKREIIVNNNIYGNNNKSMISSRIISNKELIKNIINVYVEKDTIDNIALEDLKGITNGGLIQIEPNITCLSNEVSANHLTTIGNFSKEAINYLMSKGLKELEAKKLILQGFIYSNQSDYIKNMGGD